MLPDSQHITARVTLQQAEEARDRLEREIEHAKKGLRGYRATLGQALSDNDQR